MAKLLPAKSMATGQLCDYPFHMKQCRKKKCAGSLTGLDLHLSGVLSKTWSSNREKPRRFRAKTRKSSSIVRASEMNGFFELTEDAVIQNFLMMDSCKAIADKYLLSMVFAYFKRAKFSLHEYSVLNFFVALYLANDMEEDEEDLKHEILPWALGETWRRRFKDFVRLRDLLFRRMDYRAIVSRKCCEEIMAVEPDHVLWKRCRPDYHSGAWRTYGQDSSYGVIYGPWDSPPICPDCHGHQMDS